MTCFSTSGLGCVAPGHHRAAGRLASVALACASLCAPALAQQPAAADAAATLDEVFVTATARPEERSRIAGTTQVIGREAIAHSSARSVTDLLAEHAVGFFSEWTAAQTSMNLRGAATDGQGRDFRSQVLVLVNGRRAGTANLSKLSPTEVERIEIVRGPASVLYGSQNMGGIVNVIMKSGQGQPPASVQLRGGSWGQYHAQAQTSGASGNMDWFVGVSAGGREDYDSGLGHRMENTAWRRRGASAAWGWQLNEQHRLDVNLRTDGIFDAGFRGSGANTLSRDNRSNRSLDLVYDGASADQRLGWTAHLYRLKDVDEFNWASPVIRSGSNPAPGTARDYNRRNLDATGARLHARAALTPSNDVLLGYDTERSKLRSQRERLPVPGGPARQVPPIDYNQTEQVHALYFEDAQRLLDDRLTLRGGLRKTWGRTHFDDTPHLAAQRAAARSYDALTWSLGATYRLSEQTSLRALAATGFRAPTATELAADFTALGGGRSFGNPNLKPERARQLEVGATWQGAAWRLDGALFQNTISDRIITISRGPGTNTSDYGNNRANIVARGLEASAHLRLDQALGWGAGAPALSLFGHGYYHFTMQDKGAAAALESQRVQRMYRHALSAGLRYGQGREGQAGAWNVQLAGILRGPMRYDTEESLLIPQAEPRRAFLHRKGSFTVWNLRGQYQLSQSLRLFAAVNNLLDKNQHPIFISTDRGAACISDRRFQNGGCGTSMPGREFQLGLEARF
ncbi:TonB-dependent receptor [Vandammella animalimorsus]|uniref:TonB-dependent receptor n=1 Tax=Vandammella animalimorsus TaxID=2029117 RepID=A0A2A2ANA3_9BURK|nr:TonB-dependent receptor [Vandammella animalimorsus]PAT39218.1 TonB-dependent receptor [Vandammella animalimorsus]